MSRGKSSTKKDDGAKRDSGASAQLQSRLRAEKAELLKAALLGTYRYELAEPEAAGGLQSLYTKLYEKSGETDAPHQLLSLAGVYFFRHRVGTQPLQVLGGEREAVAGAANGPETQPPCNTLASQNLAALLWGYSPDLLSEFLSVLAATNQRIPDQYLPTVLARGAKTTNVRSLILPVLDHTGRWLAAQNPEWSYATALAATDEGARGLLQTLPHAKRQSFLRQLRHSDPALARKILQSQWKSTVNADRATYIKVLNDGLSLEDESFLEQALDDRNSVVRRKAAELLAMLPGSQLCSRVTERAEGFLNWEPESENRIVVRFPKEITPQMVRDGVMIRKLRDESRVRAYLMKEIVGAIPLSHWTTTWDASPDEIIAATRSSRWPRTLKQAFVIAAERQRDIEWAKALLANDNYGVSTIRLINLLPIEACEQILLTVGQDEIDKLSAEPDDTNDDVQDAPKPPLNKESIFVRILRKRKDPWTEQIFMLWLDRLTAHIDYDLAERAKADEEKKRNADSATPEPKAAQSKTIQPKTTQPTTILPKATQQPPIPLTGNRSGDTATSIDPILRLLIRQSGRCCPVELTPHVVETMRPYGVEFTVWRPIVQELISTIKFRQAMITNLKGAK